MNKISLITCLFIFILSGVFAEKTEYTINIQGPAGYKAEDIEDYLNSQFNERGFFVKSVVEGMDLVETRIVNNDMPVGGLKQDSEDWNYESFNKSSHYLTFFVNDYFKGIKSRDLKESYSYLSLNLKEESGDLNSYIKWWSSIKSVKTHSAVVSNSSETDATINTIIEYNFPNGDKILEEYDYYLIFNINENRWLFDKSEYLGKI